MALPFNARALFAHAPTQEVVDVIARRDDAFDKVQTFIPAGPGPLMVECARKRCCPWRLAASVAATTSDTDLLEVMSKDRRKGVAQAACQRLQELREPEVPAHVPAGSLAPSPVSYPAGADVIRAVATRQGIEALDISDPAMWGRLCEKPGRIDCVEAWALLMDCPGDMPDTTVIKIVRRLDLDHFERWILSDETLPTNGYRTRVTNGYRTRVAEKLFASPSHSSHVINVFVGGARNRAAIDRVIDLLTAWYDDWSVRGWLPDVFAAKLAARIGNDPHRWEVAIGLATHWRGTIDELVDTVHAIA